MDAPLELLYALRAMMISLARNLVPRSSCDGPGRAHPVVPILIFIVVVVATVTMVIAGVDPTLATVTVSACGLVAATVVGRLTGPATG